jgi:tetratricopeptide (TPR) repeat protein
MKKTIFTSILASMLIGGSIAAAKPINVKITVGNNTFNLLLLSRDGTLINFQQEGKTGNVSYPSDAIKEIIFPLEIDDNAVEKMQENRSYEELVSMFASALKPYADYHDLPSNLAPYEGELMELYFKLGQHKEALEIALRISKDDRDPELQRKARVYHGMALIEDDRVTEAEALFQKYGWTENLPSDSEPEDLYITAKFLAAKKEYGKAIEMVAKVISFSSQDIEWARPAELLCAQVYAELGLLDSADEVIREISLLYKGSDEDIQAQELKKRVDKLRADQLQASNK